MIRKVSIIFTPSIAFLDAEGRTIGHPPAAFVEEFKAPYFHLEVTVHKDGTPERVAGAVATEIAGLAREIETNSEFEQSVWALAMLAKEY